MGCIQSDRCAHKRRGSGRRHRGHRVRTWGENVPCCLLTKEGGPGRNRPRPHLDPGPPASRLHEMHFCGLSVQAAALCHRGPRTLTGPRPGRTFPAAPSTDGTVCHTDLPGGGCSPLADLLWPHHSPQGQAPGTRVPRFVKLYLLAWFCGHCLTTPHDTADPGGQRCASLVPGRLWALRRRFAKK